MDIKKNLLKSEACYNCLSENNHYIQLKERVYACFLDGKINTLDEMSSILRQIKNDDKKCFIQGWKSIIICAFTDFEWKSKDLLFCDGIDLNAVFFLLNTKKEKVFSDYSFSFPLGTGYRKITKEFGNKSLLFFESKKTD